MGEEDNIKFARCKLTISSSDKEFKFLNFNNGSNTRTIVGAGNDGGTSNVIDYVTTASTGNATDFGNVEEEEMYQAFNMGIGMVFIVDNDSVDSIEKALKNITNIYTIGEVIEGENIVHYN